MESDSPKISHGTATVLFEEILNSGSSLRVKATGRSMSPFLRGGEVFTIRHVPWASLRKGDLIFFKSSSETLLLHRLIRKGRSLDGGVIFQTKGDALIAFDEPVPCHRILGRVWNIEKVSSARGQRLINMESMRWRMINYLIALTAAITSLLYHNLARLKRCLVQFFQRTPRLTKSAKT